MWWKTDVDSGLSGKAPGKTSLVLKISPELKAEFEALVVGLKFKRHNKAFEELVIAELGRRGKSLKDREFAKPKRR